MKKTILLVLLSIINFSALAEVVYSQNDDNQLQKEELLNDLIAIMGKNGSVSYVANHEKYLLWTNKAAVLFDSRENVYKETKLPSFTMISDQNSQQLQKIFEQQTGLILTKDQIAGILIADPNEGAIMYYREGYLSSGPKKVDSKVAPAVIIYHEFSHAKDSLLSSFYFTEMATQFDKRYKNHAEKSAVNQQNDFVLTAQSLGISVGGLRQSYGQNDLVKVLDPWTIP